MGGGGEREREITCKFLFSDCFFKQGELNFALQDYLQALELDGSDVSVGARISVIHNEFGVNLYQEKDYIVSLIHQYISIFIIFYI